MGHDYTVAGSSSASNAKCQLYITAEGSTLKIRMGVQRTSGSYYSWWYNHNITITVNGTSVTKGCYLNAKNASGPQTTSGYTLNTWYYMSTTTGANSRITDPNSSYAVVWQFTGVADAKAITMSFSSGTGGFGNLTVNNSTATRTEHTITFNINGGNSTVPSSITNLYNATVTLPGAATHANGSTTRTLTASYNGNGNTGGSTTASTATQSGSYPWSFGGWNTNSSGTGTNYAASSSYTIGTTSPTLYAK